MRYAEYVIPGYVLTGAVVGGYWVWVVARLRRARKVSPDE